MAKQRQMRFVGDRLIFEVRWCAVGPRVAFSQAYSSPLQAQQLIDFSLHLTQFTPSLVMTIKQHSPPCHSCTYLQLPWPSWRSNFLVAIFPAPAHALVSLLWGWLSAPHTTNACVLALGAWRAVCARSPPASRPVRLQVARCGTSVASENLTTTVVGVVTGRVVGFWTLVFLLRVCIFSRVA